MNQDQKLDLLIAEVQGMKADIHGLKSDMQGMKSDIQDLKSAVAEGAEAIQMLSTNTDAQLQTIRAEMATKDFVDRRFNQLDAKVGTLTDTLAKKDVITKDEARNVMTAS